MSDRITRRGQLINRHILRDTLVPVALAAGQAQLAGVTGGGAMTGPMFPQERAIYRGLDSVTGAVLFVREIFDENTGAVTYEYSDVADFSNLITPANPINPLNSSGDKQLNLLEADSETIAVTDAATVSLTVPATAVGALVQVEIDSGAGCLRLYADGRTPTQTDGLKATHLAQVSLGISPVADGDVMELGNFLAITEAGTTATLRVEYYEEV